MKFDYTLDFQYDILKFTVTDINGYRALELYDDSYFSLNEHAVIAYTLKKFYKSYKRIPGKTILLQELNDIFNHRDFVNNLTDEDRGEIISITKSLFKGDLKDSDQILKKIETFAQYVDLKGLVENINLLDYNQYEVFSRKVQKAISPRLKTIEERGNFLFKDIRDRQIRRKDSPSIVPLPYKGLNRLTNAGGYSKGSILVVLDRAKKFKTGFLVNIAARYLRNKKNILVIDLDNGEDDWHLRLEQCLMKLTKADLLSGDNKLESDIRKRFRHHKRVSGEIVIKRMPALVTTTTDIESYMDFLYNEFGFRPHILILDYIAKMGCVSGKDSLHERISEAYIDMGNLALKYGVDHVWTAQHVTREAAKVREKKIYDATDVAGAIDITRHVQAIYGLNRSDREERENIQRLEIIDQRDGIPHGKVLFKVDIKKQILEEFTKDEYEEYYDKFGDQESKEDSSYEQGRRKPLRKNLDVE